MAEIGSYYIDIDIPTEYLTNDGASIQFEMSKECCNGGNVNKEYRFALVRCMQCNGALLRLPIVCFKRKQNTVEMTVLVALKKDDPLLVPCARTLLRVEYFE